MHIRTINKVTTIGLSALSALTLCSVLAALYFQNEQVRSLEQQRESLKLANQLAQGSDLLTNAVRSFAATGEAKYEDAYNHEVNIDRSRDKAVQGLAALGTPGNELSLIEEAKRNSDDLINLENRSFDVGRAGNLKLAVELVYGPSYHTAKAKIMSPIGQFRQIMNQRLAEKVAQASRKADASIAAAVSMVIASILATILVQLMFYRRKVVSPLLQMQAEVDGLVARKENAVLSALDDDSEIGSLARSITAYHNIALQLENQQQTKQQLSEIVVALQRAVDLPNLAQKLMSHISPILDVGYGLFYVADAEKRTLRTVGGYGLAPGDSDREVVFGDGLAGQCAIDQKPILITDPPADYIRIASGTGKATPACIMLWPLIQNKIIVGVVELASFLPFDDGDEAFLAELEPILAANVMMFRHQQDIEKEYTRQRASEDRMNAIISSVSDGIYGLDMDGNTMFVNPAAAHMLGYQVEELIGTPMHAIVHHSDADGTPFPREECPMYATSQDGKPRFITDDVIWRKDGKSVQVEYSTMAWTDKDGKQVGSVIAIHDITERKNTESRLRDQFAFQQALIDTIPYPVFYKGPDTRFLGCNRAYEETFNVRRENLIGKRVLDLEYLPAADRTTYQAEDERVISEASSIHREMSIPFADGKVHDTLYFVSGFRHEDGDPGGLVGTFIDVSDRKKIEDLERFHRLALGREERIMELKQEVNALAAEAHKEKPYSVENIFLESGAAETVDTADVLPTLSENEAEIIKHDFAELIQREHLKELFDGFCETVGFATSIIDREGMILAASRRQPVCTDFRRADGQSCANCIESDTKLASRLEEGQDFTMYRCKNGMNDCVAPVVVKGRHVANIFVGQFHLKKPDVAFFRRQAAKFGFDAEAYVTAVKNAPVMDEAKLPHILDFLIHFAQLVGSFAVEQREMQLAQQATTANNETLRRECITAMSVAEDAEMALAKLASSQTQT